MPLESKDVDGGLGNIVIGKGIVTEQEFVDVFTRHLTQDEETFKRYRYSLTDYSAVTSGEVSIKTIDSICALSKSAATINRDIVIAGVANQDLYFGLLRMAHARRDQTGWENMAFRDRAAAEDWIRARLESRYGIENLTFT